MSDDLHDLGHPLRLTLAGVDCEVLHLSRGRGEVTATAIGVTPAIWQAWLRAVGLERGEIRQGERLIVSDALFIGLRGRQTDGFGIGTCEVRLVGG